MSADENITEGGIPAGTWNKYRSRNPIQRLLVARFLRKLQSMAAPWAAAVDSALDVGCGEGVTTRLFYEAGIRNIVGADFSFRVLEEAREQNPEIRFVRRNVYALDATEPFDFVSACEVLEHLDDPARALEKIAAICRRVAVFSVPDEPLFRSLNFLAGKYWKDFGNSPGHLNHWSARAITREIGKYFDVKATATPLPWTIVVATPKGGGHARDSR